MTAARTQADTQDYTERPADAARGEPVCDAQANPSAHLGAFRWKNRQKSALPAPRHWAKWETAELAV